MPIKPHPTDLDKMVYVKREYNLPKEWVGLTGDEVDKCSNLCFYVPDIRDVIRAIEAKLRGKNGF